MILWSDKIEKTKNIFPGVKDILQKRNIDIDGVIEVFNNGIEQGTLLKIFDKYNPKMDMCIWVYLPSERISNNQMEIIIGSHLDCSKNNMWIKKEKSKIITEAKARDLHDKVRNYIVDIITSNLDKKIEKRKEKERE